MDGDGIVNGEPQYANSARVQTEVLFITGIKEEGTIDVTSGPDKDFDTEEDNQIISLSWQKTKNGNLKGSAAFVDADGDGFVLNKASQEPSLVDVSLYEADNPFKPFVDHSQLEMRLEVTGDNQDGRIIKISGEEVFKSGRVNRVWAVNSQGDSILSPDDPQWTSGGQLRRNDVVTGVPPHPTRTWAHRSPLAHLGPQGACFGFARSTSIPSAPLGALGLPPARSEGQLSRSYLDQ